MSSPHTALAGLNELAEEVRRINKANGWRVTQPGDWCPGGDDEHGYRVYKIPAVLALIHSEVSEALEAFRVNDRINFDEELADIIIRLLDLCAGLVINIEAELLKKVEKNRHRAHRHGGC